MFASGPGPGDGKQISVDGMSNLRSVLESLKKRRRGATMDHLRGASEASENNKNILTDDLKKSVMGWRMRLPKRLPKLQLQK